MDKKQIYSSLETRIRSLSKGENDPVSLMATMACEIFHFLPYCDWAGFYRVVDSGTLKIGPYQGPHGCLVIPFDRGVCGKCARTQEVQLVGNVSVVSDHIACSSKTKSEIVVPVFDVNGKLMAVLDLDSNTLNAFDETDSEGLVKITGIFRSVPV